MKTKEIYQFKKRFGEKIPDNILSLFLEDEGYRYSINNAVGRELISDILHIMTILIKEVGKGNKEKAVELEEYKKIGSKWNDIIKKAKKKSEDDYEKSVLNEDKETLLINRLGEKGVKDLSRTLISLDRFFHAYNNDIGKILNKDIEDNIDGGIKSIWESRANGELVAYNAYKTIRSYWNTKIASREKILAQVQTLINRRFK